MVQVFARRPEARRKTILYIFDNYIQEKTSKERKRTNCFIGYVLVENMDSSGDETFNENISDGSTSSKKTYPNASDMGEGTMMKQDRSFRGISGSERLAAESKITGKPFGVRIEGVSLDENYHRKEAELWQAKKRARRTIGRDQMTDDDKCIERRAANRLAAFQSRQRKKAIIEELQVSRMKATLVLPVHLLLIPVFSG